jgi:hypothetical protein
MRVERDLILGDRLERMGRRECFRIVLGEHAVFVDGDHPARNGRSALKFGLATGSNGSKSAICSTGTKRLPMVMTLDMLASFGRVRQPTLAKPSLRSAAGDLIKRGAPIQDHEKARKGLPKSRNFR